MASPTTPVGGTAANAAVARLVVEIQAGSDELVDGIVARIRDELPDFRRLPASTLARAVRGNVGRALAALAELRPPTAAELEGGAAVGRERGEQGLSVDGVLHAYRISISAVWTRFGELARERGVDVTSVLAFSEIEFENRYVCRDGSVRWFQWASRPVPEQGLMYAVARDVTDRKRGEAEQAALRRVATLVARAVAPAEVFDAVTREVGLQCDADLARLERFEPDGTVTVVAAWSRSGTDRPAVGTRFALDGTSIAALVSKTGRPAQVDGSEGSCGPIARENQALGIRSSVGCPIVVGGRIWGVIAASTKGDAHFPPNTDSRLAEFTELVATAVLNAESQRQLTASRARLLTEADAVRRRIVRDLHDGAQQRLVHTAITLGLAERELEADDEAAQALIAEALGHLQQANEDLRELAHGILPADLQRGGLRGGIDAVVERLDVAVKVDLPPERFPAEIEASAYFIVAEALTNIVKHARAESAAVSASIDDGMLQVKVCDDGIGGADPGGRGLVGIHDRVTALGGQFSVESPAGGGTVLTATLPISVVPADAA